MPEASISKHQPMRPALSEVLDSTNMSRFRFGKTDHVEIEAGASSSGSVTFATPFADTADVCVFPCCVSGLPILDEVKCTLISATHSGFSYSIINNDTENAHTVSLGYVAVQVN